jgi:hypothetical protein
MLFDPITGHVVPPYEGWRPYCLVCSTFVRMEAKPWGGWECVACRNQVGPGLERRPPGREWKPLPKRLK